MYTRLIEEKVNIKPRKLNRLWSGNQDINRRRKIDCDLNLGLTIPTITCQGTLVFTTASPNAIPYLIIFLYLPELIKRGSLKDLRLKKKKKKHPARSRIDVVNNVSRMNSIHIDLTTMAIPRCISCRNTIV